MKTQLLMIIAVIVSSLLTISQRVHAQEVSQFRWLEPSVEQTFDKLATPDKDHDSSNTDIACITCGYFVTVQHHAAPLPKAVFITADYFRDSINPRAPPFSLI